MKKFLLVALTTTREIGGVQKRVRFPAKSTQDLTKKELAELDALTETTSKLHYRDPVDESGKAADTDDDDGEQELFAGASVDMEDKTVTHLKAYLDHFEVEYEDKANKAALKALAEAHADEAADGDADPDGGL